MRPSLLSVVKRPIGKICVLEVYREKSRAESTLTWGSLATPRCLPSERHIARKVIETPQNHPPRDCTGPPVVVGGGSCSDKKKYIYAAFGRERLSVGVCRVYCVLPIMGTKKFFATGVLVQLIEQPVAGRRTLSHHTTYYHETGQRDTQRHREASSM